MAYEWNPLWTEPADNSNPAYVASVHRAILASINWIAEHPEAAPEWREPNRRELARAAGAPDSVDIGDIAFIGAWDRFYNPRNQAAEEWFKAIVDACSLGSIEAEPSVFMMDKAVACGMLVKNKGWDEFNRFMLQRIPDENGH